MGEVWSVKSVREDPMFNLDTLEAESDGRNLTLELPKGLVNLREWNSFEINISKEEEDGDVVMKGIVYKCEGNRLEISIYGLWLRADVSKCDLSEGEEVYVIIRRLD